MNMVNLPFAEYPEASSYCPRIARALPEAFTGWPHHRRCIDS
ncbi:MAG: hypothetical protein WBP11_00060 [Dokdonella sp.]